MPAPSSSSCEAGNEQGFPAVYSRPLEHQPPPAAVSQIPGIPSGSSSVAAAGPLCRKALHDDSGSSQARKAGRVWSRGSPSAEAVAECSWQATLEALTAGAGAAAMPISTMWASPIPPQPLQVTPGAPAAGAVGDGACSCHMAPVSRLEKACQVEEQQQEQVKGQHGGMQQLTQTQVQCSHQHQQLPVVSTSAAVSASIPPDADVSSARYGHGFDRAAAATEAAAGVPSSATSGVAEDMLPSAVGVAAPRKKLTIKIKPSSKLAQQQRLEQQRRLEQQQREQQQREQQQREQQQWLEQQQREQQRLEQQQREQQRLEQQQREQHRSLPTSAGVATSGAAANAGSGSMANHKIRIRVKHSRTGSGSAMPAVSGAAAGVKRGAEVTEESSSATSSPGDVGPDAKKSRLEGPKTATEQLQAPETSDTASSQQRQQEAKDAAWAVWAEQQRQKKEQLHALAMQLPDWTAYMVIWNRSQGYRTPLKNVVFPPANGRAAKRIPVKSATKVQQGAEEGGGDSNADAAAQEVLPRRSRLSRATYGS